MKEGWKSTVLGDVCRFENGDRGRNYPGRKAFVSTGIPFINAGHLSDGRIDWSSMNFISRERFDLLGNGKIEKGDLLFCLRGSLGKFGLVDKDAEGAIASSLVIVRPTKHVDQSYLSAYFRSEICSRMIDRYSNGTAQPNLSAKCLKLFELPLPPLPEQKRIVAILEEAFAGIATAVANTEKNLANSYELLESYLNSIFGNRGDGWVDKTLDQLCVIARGGSPRPIKAFLTDEPNGINWIKIGDATASSKFIYETKQKIRSEGVKHSRMVHEGDLLLSNSMSFGRPYIMRTSGCIHDGWLVLSDKCGSYETNYLYYFLGSPQAYRQFDLRAAGSTVRNLNIDLVRSVQVPVPPLAEQAQVSANIEELEAESQRLEFIYRRKLTNLAELKRSLLQKAFSGELIADKGALNRILKEEEVA